MVSASVPLSCLERRLQLACFFPALLFDSLTGVDSASHYRMLFSGRALVARAITSHREQGVLRQVPSDPCWKNTRLHIRLVELASPSPPSRIFSARDDVAPIRGTLFGVPRQRCGSAARPDSDSSQYVLLKNYELRQATQTRHPS